MRRISYLALEHVSFDQQDSVDRYIYGQVDWDEFRESYTANIGFFDIEMYKPLFEYARRHGIRIIGLSPPRIRLLQILDEGERALARLAGSFSREHFEFWKYYHENVPYIIEYCRFLEWLKSRDPRNVILMMAYMNAVMTENMYTLLKDMPKERLSNGPPVMVVITDSIHVSFIGSIPMQLNKYIPWLGYRIAVIHSMLTVDNIAHKAVQPGTILDYLVNVT